MCSTAGVRVCGILPAAIYSRRLRSRDQGLLRRTTPCFSHTALFQRERSALARRRCPSMAAVGNCMAALSSEPSALHKHQRPLRCAQQRAFVFVEYSRQRSTLPCSFPHSTIDGSRLNFRVRNGNGCGPAPMTTGNLLTRPSGFRLQASGPEEPSVNRVKLFKDQELIFNNSIFCTRLLFRIHIARSVQKNMVKPHDLLVPVS